MSPATARRGGGRDGGGRDGPPASITRVAAVATVAASHAEPVEVAP